VKRVRSIALDINNPACLTENCRYTVMGPKFAGSKWEALKTLLLAYEEPSLSLARGYQLGFKNLGKEDYEAFWEGC
jgi:hypothetical protein